MHWIQSTKNEKVKRWKKLLTKKGRERSGQFLVEGEHLVEEAHQAGVISELIVSKRYRGKLEQIASQYDTYEISREVEKVISDTETPQGIFAVCRQFSVQKEANGKRFLLIDAVQDPGNIGTMIRTADAAGIDLVILGEGCADLYNPKVLRAAQGSHFHIPVQTGNLIEWIERFHQKQIPVYGTAFNGAVPMKDVQTGGPFALIVGNEGKGVDQKLLSRTTKNLYIPIYGKCESLNVAVATGILMYYLRGGAEEYA